MSEASLALVLQAIADLLLDSGEARIALRLRMLATQSLDARDIDEQREVARRVLALYGGMGSFQDLVLQDDDGVRAEQAVFDRLRKRLFETARASLA